MQTWRSLLIPVASLCLLLGLVLPIMRVERLYFFSQTPSIIDLLLGLVSDGQWGLAVLIGLCSVIFPALKLCLLAYRHFARHNSGYGESSGENIEERSGGRVREGDRAGDLVARILPHLSKWSMIDVMLVALFVFAAKSSGLAVAIAMPGLWFYAASAILVGLLVPPSGETGSHTRRDH
ncbi:paraquat-inducible protein A [Rhizobium sp. SSA_523]|uniref:paraquat-inducible protein A n=1 Tax=Rhizobium sp. SSA_523 TaxID=2952477 RepID=UPI0020908CBE|nr:paraquat-inducible protein A [Rhizobium sp. SSA_523]MCO5732069.1 paraquat-inducible protein A [Rhizobium sp. SSA_523]WKC22594.1 paraquat-inducible protein A [Rhizobium sp. SSA_523]